MIVGRSDWEYVLIQAVIFLFSYVGLACLIYFYVVLAVGGVRAIEFPLSIVIEAVGLAEILFYFCWFLPYKAYLQRQRAVLPPPLSRAERRELFHKGLQHTPDVELYIRKWMLNAHVDDFRQENMKDWLLWALFDREGPPGEDDEELMEYIAEVEKLLEIKIKPGRSEARVLRLNFDPVPISHRSLFFYLTVGSLDSLMFTVLWARGFKFYRRPLNTFFKVFPPRPLSLLASRSASAKLSYFCRRHRSTKARPIVFMHGIGIGLTSYIPFLLSLPSDIGILAIEILPVSSRITSAIPPMTDLVPAIAAILTQQNLSSFVFVAHSYGSLFVAPFLASPLIAPRLHSVILTDPVALLLHLPDVAFNFTRRKPATANEWELWYIQTDPGVASSLARHFCWRECVLWTEQLQGRRMTVVLGELDSICDPHAVANYVHSGDVQAVHTHGFPWKNSVEQWTGEHEVELMWFGGMDHGQPFLSRAAMPHLIRAITTYCSLEGPEMKDGTPEVERKGLGIEGEDLAEDPVEE